MSEQNEQIDNLFKQTIEAPDKIPFLTKWNSTEGWNAYQNKYFSMFAYRRKQLMIAACISFLIIAGTLFLLLHNKQTRELCSFNGSDRLVKEVFLKGGHHCYLAPDTKIQYCRNIKLNQADTLYLEGEGYFETSEIKKLVIIAKNTVTNCTHSKVDIKSNKSSKSTTITPVTGQVISRCTDNNFPEIVIAPNEKCLIYEGGIYAAKEINDDPNFLAWKTGTLSFNNIPLSYAIRTIEDYYGVKIEVQSDEIKYCRMTSEFENTKIEDVLKFIQDSYKTKIKKTDNAIVLEEGICR